LFLGKRGEVFMVVERVATLDPQRAYEELRRILLKIIVE